MMLGQKNIKSGEDNTAIRSVCFAFYVDDISRKRVR